MSRTEISNLGEFGLIDRISSAFKLQNASSVLGIGDDAAVIDAGAEYTLLATDMLNEGVHFDLSYAPLRHLGYKAIAVNVSDIAAMNGKAEQVVVSLGLSNRFSVEAVDELYEGMKIACEQYGVDLVGGDTTTSRAGLIINIAVLGKTAKEDVVYRKGAKPFDLICVTGDLGGAYMGLQVLEREKQVFMANPDMQPDLAGKDYIVQRQLKPEARVDVIKQLKELGLKPTSMIDISDGLASEVLHLCKNSGTGAAIYEEKLPIHQLTFDTAREFELEPTTIALNGGEDYELLFTISQADVDKVRNHPDITLIGHMTDPADGIRLITEGGNMHPLTAQGWTHF